MQDQLLQPLLNLESIEKQFSEEEIKNLTALLGNQLVRRYFQTLFNSSVQEFMVNEAETPEQEQKLVARFKKLKGIQYLCTFILNNFQEVKLEQPKK